MRWRRLAHILLQSQLIKQTNRNNQMKACILDSTADVLSTILDIFKPVHRDLKTWYLLVGRWKGNPNRMSPSCLHDIFMHIMQTYTVCSDCTSAWSHDTMCCVPAQTPNAARREREEMGKLSTCHFIFSQCWESNKYNLSEMLFRQAPFHMLSWNTWKWLLV